MRHLLVFRSEASMPGMYDSLFWGIFRREGLPELLQSLLLPCFVVSVVFVTLQWMTQRKYYGRLGEIFSFLLFFIIVFLLHDPWDELFVNLRHSLHLSEGFGFSFSRLQSIEATVDFLPYFIIGMLGALGAPIIELSIVQSLLGALLCILGARYLCSQVKLEGAKRTLLVLLTCTFPPLCFNASQGFTTTIFLASMIWATNFLLFSKHRICAYFILSIIPLIRLEGSLFVLLLIGLDTGIAIYQKGSIKKCVVPVFYVFLPALILSLGRYYYYGSPIPLPIQFKSAMGSEYHLKLGIRNFIKDITASLSLLSLGTLVFALLGRHRFHIEANRVGKILGSLVLCVFVFVVPYYISGGDWFPHSWARYLLPLSFFSFVVAYIVTFSNLQFFQHEQRLGLAFGIGIIFLASLVNPKWNSLRSLYETLWHPYAGKGGLRIHQLSQVGNLLGRVTHKNEKIASSELATVMYFADREAIDLLGVANPALIEQPLQNHPNLAFRKRKPSLLLELSPEIIWPYDYTTYLNRPSATDAEIVSELEKRHRRYSAANHFRFNGNTHLEQIGYQPVAVLMQGFSTFYFVSKKSLSSHVQRLTELGFQMTELSAPSQEIL